MADDAFHDVTFPAAATIGATGGPVRRTDIVGLASGREVRRSRWSRSLRSWSLATGSLGTDEAAALLAFFEAREGRRYAFRYRDPLDHSSNGGDGMPGPEDQLLSTGDGVKLLFPLIKTYGSTLRDIQLPVQGALRIALDGVEQISGWTASSAGVLFDQPPAVGVLVTAGYRFDVPVRFGEDRLSMRLAARGASAELTLQEVRL